MSIQQQLHTRYLIAHVLKQWCSPKLENYIYITLIKIAVQTSRWKGIDKCTSKRICGSFWILLRLITDLDCTNWTTIRCLSSVERLCWMLYFSLRYNEIRKIFLINSLTIASKVAYTWYTDYTWCTMHSIVSNWARRHIRLDPMYVRT